MVVKSIKDLTKIMSVRVVHSLRKDYTLADFLTNFMFTCASDFQCNNEEKLLGQGRSIFALDDASIPNIRRME